MDPVDWQTGKTPLQCTKYMLEKKLNCDVNFKVGKNKENVKAHKFILSMRSAVFDRMFNGSFCESEKDPVIPDVTSAAFKMLLRYCYYECLDIKDDVAISVLYASTKYMLPLLEEAARKKLIKMLSGSNVWDIYTYAINVGDTKLLEGCHMYFQGNITSVKEALQAEAFRNIPHKVLLDLLHINDKAENSPSLKGDPINSLDSEIYVNNCGISISEVELFRACNTWAGVECLRQEIDQTGTNKRTVLGDCLCLIRFPTMLDNDLVNVVYATGILNQTEKYYSQTGSQGQVDFSSRERQFVVTTPSPKLFIHHVAIPFFKKPPRDPPGDTGTVYIESDVRLLLSRIWVRVSGRHRVTVRDETTEELWSMNYDSRFQCHCSNKIEVLKHIDIKPQLLEAGIKYSVTAERTKDAEPPDLKLVTKWVMIEELSPFKEVKVTHGPREKNCIHALTLCLV